ncbi:MAG: AAA family ATPase [Anaerolineae bacterium]
MGVSRTLAAQTRPSGADCKTHGVRRENLTLQPIAPDHRPQEWAIHAFDLWELKNKTRPLLARRLGLSDRSLARWASGERTPDLENVAKTLFHLYAEGCFDDLAQASDLAWLMGLTAQSLADLVQRIFATEIDAKVREFLEWLWQATASEEAKGLSPGFLPSLPAYYVPTGLARQVKEALLTPREYRVPLHQVVALHGGPGVGKTTTAASLLCDEQVSQFFRDGTLFIPLANEEDRGQALMRACEQAGLPVGRHDTVADQQQAFQQWAQQEARLALLVLDDPQRVEDLTPLLSVGPQVRILITCQDRRTVARALEEHWEPTSELVLWTAVSGLEEAEGLVLLNRWRSQDLLSEEERARQRVGELLRWHPAALRLCAGEANAVSWQNVESLVLEGNLDPDDFGELASWIQKSWERLSLADQEALSDLLRILREASTFGTGFAAAVWDQELPQAALRITRLEGRGLIERVSQEPQPWQTMIQQTYGGEERYRLMPLFRLIDIQTSEGSHDQIRSGAEEVRWLRAVGRRARARPNGPGQIPWRFRLANLLVLPFVWLLRGEPGELEEQLMHLWDRQGVRPPAEVWLTFQKSRWLYVPFGYTIGTVLVVIGAWYLGSAIREGEAVVGLVTLACWATALLTFQLSVRQRAWWLWLLGLHGQETTELKWTWRLARWFGLRKPAGNTATVPRTARGPSQ